MSEEDPQAQTVDQPAVTPDPGAGAHREANLDALLDVPVNVTVEIGRVSLPIKGVAESRTGVRRTPRSTRWPGP